MKKERKKIAVVITFFAVVVIFGNSAIEFFGEARCFTVAHFMGELFAPIFLIGAIALISYFFWYFAWNVPRKILVQLKKSD